MTAKSIKGKSPDEIQAALLQCMADSSQPNGQGFKPTVALMFISIKQERQVICEILHREGIDVIGATSCGEFINGYQDEGSIVIMLLDLDPTSYTILFEDIANRDLTTVATQIGRTALQKFEHPAIILCTTGNSANGSFLGGEILIRSLEEVFGSRPVKIYGGMAGDDATFTGSYVFTHQQSSDQAVLAWIIDEDKINLQGMAISGWKPLGIERTVTKSEGGWIYTIDDQPALEMYLKYLGKQRMQRDDKFEIFEEVGVHYPFHVEGIGDPVLRTPMMIDRDTGALKLDFDVPQGAKLRFSMPPDFDIVENVLEKAGELKNSIQSDAEALLIFSCAGRLSALGPLTNMENDGLAEIWKAPMAGFYTYGEYGTTETGKQGFHSTTISWAALIER